MQVVYLSGVKDVSELHCAAGDSPLFVSQLVVALGKAEPFRSVEEQAKAAAMAKAWAVCKELAEAPDILARAVAVVHALGVVGEEAVIRLVFLAIVSRLFRVPISVAVKGPSSCGKSWIVEQVVSLFPASAVFPLSAVSERHLVYSTEPLAHRMILFYEAAGLGGDFSTYIIRSLLSEGRIVYGTVDKTSGKMEGRTIVREGPSGLIVTTTEIRLHPENETRLISIQATDTQAQTAAVIQGFGTEIEKMCGGDPGAVVDLTPWHALQDWLANGETRVAIPFSKELLLSIKPVAVRLRRDVRQVLMLVCAHALLHRASRKLDDLSCIVATLADYEAVRALAEPLVAAGVGATVSPAVRETVEAVAKCKEATVTILAVAEALQLDSSAAWRRVRRAINEGYLVNQEDKPRRPARLKLGAPLPDDADVLPLAELLRAAEDAETAKSANSIETAEPVETDDGKMRFE